MVVRSNAVRSKLDWWDCGFKSRWGHRLSSLVFVMCCVGSVLCNELITSTEGSNRVYVSKCVWFKTYLSTVRAVTPGEKKWFYHGQILTESYNKLHCHNRHLLDVFAVDFSSSKILPTCENPSAFCIPLCLPYVTPLFEAARTNWFDVRKYCPNN